MRLTVIGTIFCAAWLFAGCTTVAPANTQAFAHIDGSEVMMYQVYSPELTLDSKGNYTGEPLPLVVFLHGSGERGSDNQQQMVVGMWFAEPRVQDANPSFILAPQCPEGRWWHGLQLEQVRAILDRTMADYPIDPDRVYITGHSMGGHGTWEMLYNNPGMFAAAAPVCFGYDTERASAFANMPTWVFHGDADHAVPVEDSRAMVKALRAVGAPVKYTEYPGVRHDSWIPAYHDDDFIAWLFAQRRNAAGE